MILSYLYNILKFKQWEIFFFATVFIGLKWSKITSFKPDINNLIELETCPACFGTSACDYINKVDVTPYDFYSTFSYFFGVKNVFMGTLNGNKVILKKLAHNSELNEFDRMLCESKELSRICTKNLKKVDDKNDVNFRELIKREITSEFANDSSDRLIVCPSLRNLNKLLQNVYLNNENVDPKVLDINIWMLTVLNPEPLILQILSRKNWPVPKYFGACGRIIIEEYVGSPLTVYYNEPWLIRAKIASSLLDAAHLFTSGSDEFGFYLTDISADNIAVDSNNNAKFVDLENVIIVDKNITLEARPAKWHELQKNRESSSCPECLEFSPAEICSHIISDHNYYAICKTLLALNMSNSILPGGLLHDIPKDIAKRYPNVRYLIEQCVMPEALFTRISAGTQLKDLLDTIVQEE